MDAIPGLDMLNVSVNGHKPPDIFDNSFQIPVNIGNMRTEGDFKWTTIHKLKAPITFCKGFDVLNKKEISFVIYNETDDFREELSDILHELEIISQLDHNNLLKFYETIAGNAVTDVAFVFESHGGLLSEMMAQRVDKLYEPPVIKTIMRDLFKALGYLHLNRIIHRDIQPENIVFTSSGVLKIWNFRNAQRVGWKPKKVKSNEFRYQSVEILLESGQYDESVDIWSANCIFLHLWLKRSFCPDHGREKVLEGIFKLLGFPKKDIWEEFFSFPGVNDLLLCSRIARYNMIDKFFEKKCDRVVSPIAMDLIHRCFRYNPKNRPKSEYCLLHPYFREEPGACPSEEIVMLVDHAKICDQLRAMKERKNV